jgi:cytochrome P450
MSKNLRYKEVLTNATMFMNAGFETTSLNFAYSTYELAKHPDIQSKLRAEIDEHWKENEEEPDCDVIAELTYMDMFVREVLRMYSVTHKVFNRECNTPTIIRGHFIEKGQ